MKNRLKAFCIFFSLILSSLVHAQVLSPGGIAFIGFQGDAQMAFALVNTEVIPPFTQISFTDNKWTGAHLLNNEQTVVWTSPDTALPVGTIFRLQDNGSGMTVTGPGTATGRIWYSLGQGEQILAYTGTEAQPSFIAGISNNTWRPTCDSIPYFEFRTCLPAPLVNGETALAFMDVTTINIDNGYLSITPLNVTGPDMLSIIYNINYWFLDNADMAHVGAWPNWNSGSTQPFASTIEFSAPSTSITEGGSLATITLNLSAPQISPQTAVINILEFPGITSDDYNTNPAAVNGSITLEIPANANSISFTMQGLTDGIAETNETVTFTIGALSGGLTVGNEDAFAVTIISSDQNFSRINFTSDTLHITEGQSGIPVSMNISPTASASYFVFVGSTNGAGVFNDYFTTPANSNNQILLQTEAGNPMLDFLVTPYNDNQIEPDEYVSFTIIQVSNGLQIGDTSSVTLVIHDNDNIPTYTAPLLYLNELNAFNTDYPDQNGQLDDWIELYNADTQTVSIAGYYITDLISNPTKFQFPQITAQTTMEPGSFKVLWADQNTIQGPLHLNFTLSATGGFVGLFAPDGETLIDGAQYPAMSEGNSYGRYLDGADNWKLLFYATPGAPNSDSIPPVGILSGIDFESGISLFPNPANQQVNVVKTGEALTGSINLYVMDLQGRKITAPVNNLIFGKRWTIDTSTLPSGSYILVMQSRDGIRNARFSKTN